MEQRKKRKLRDGIAEDVAGDGTGNQFIYQTAGRDDKNRPQQNNSARRGYSQSQ
jgi:hypothetical protein